MPPTFMLIVQLVYGLLRAVLWMSVLAAFWFLGVYLGSGEEW